jgi:aminoglycoside 6'-N-acetyltransferase
MAGVAYEFHPMSDADLPLVQRWLETPHVARWWGDPKEQFGLVSEDLEHPAMQQFIVALEGRPFAYLQCHDPQAWPDNGFGVPPDGTRGIDQFIGERDMVDCGHGSCLIANFVDGLFQSGVERVLTDPAPANGRAIRAYEKAGFEKVRLVETPDGRALLMMRNS